MMTHNILELKSYKTAFLKIVQKQCFFFQHLILKYARPLNNTNLPYIIIDLIRIYRTLLEDKNEFIT